MKLPLKSLPLCVLVRVPPTCVMLAAHILCWQAAPTSLAADDPSSVGFINVLDYGADPTGNRDSTEAFRAAVAAAYSTDVTTRMLPNGTPPVNELKAVFLPTGTYLVSDTIELIQPDDTPNAANRPGHLFIGAADRPIIKLASNTFTSTKKHILWLQRIKLEDTDNDGQADDVVDRPGDHVNTIVRNIIFDMGAGNSKAVALYFRGAEGCVLQNVKIHSSSGSAYYGGVEGILGSGGMIDNIEIIGGEYGIFGSAQPSPVITGAVLKDQTTLAIGLEKWTCLTLVGFQVEKQNGPVFGGPNTDNALRINGLEAPDWGGEASGNLAGEEASANLALIDGTISLHSNANPKSVVLHKDRNIYIRNVYVKNTVTVVDNLLTSGAIDLSITLPAGQWGRIDHYADGKDYTEGLSRYVDGTSVINAVQRYEAIPGTPPANLVEKHRAPVELASYDYASYVNVKDYGAKGDGVQNDREWIQNAINDASSNGNGRVFLPKGVYNVDGSLTLHSNTRLFGIAASICELDACSMTTGSAVVISPDDAEATCAIANIKIHVPTTYRGVGHILWQSGRNSTIAFIWPVNRRTELGTGNIFRLRVTGSGGGRIYNWLCEGDVGSSSSTSGMRNVFVDGTHEPLTFYMLHNQHIKVPDQNRSEFKNAKNLWIYGTKNESSLTDMTIQSNLAIPLKFDGCENFQLVGYSGLAQTRPDEGLITITGSSNYSIAQAGNWNPDESDTIYYVREVEDSNSAIVANDDVYVNILKRGSPVGSGGQTHNLIVNGDFEDGSERGWEEAPGNGFISTTYATSGNNSMGVARTGTGNIYVKQYNINVEPETAYQLSAKARTTGGSAYIRYRSGTTWTTSNLVSTNSGFETVTLVIPSSNTDTTLDIELGLTTIGSASTAYFDDVTLVRSAAIQLYDGDADASTSTFIADGGSVSLGTVNIDISSPVVSLVIKNNGGYPLTLDGGGVPAISLDQHSDVFSFISPPNGTRIPPGECLEVRVAFTPRKIGFNYSTTISIRSDDPHADRSLYTLVLSGTGTTTNLTPNAGFEETQTLTLPNSATLWNTGTGDYPEIVSATARSGSQSLRVYKTGSGNKQAWSNAINVTSGTNYSLLGWTKTNITDGTAKLDIHFNDSASTVVTSSLVANVTTNFEPISNHVTVPAGASTAGIYAKATRTPSTGTTEAFFDDILFVKNLAPNPGFATSASDWGGVASHDSSTGATALGSLKITRNGPGTFQAFPSSDINVIGSKKLHCILFAKTDDDDTRIRVKIEWKDSNGVVGSAQSTYTRSTTFCFIPFDAIAPTNATKARVYLQAVNDSQDSGSASAWFDDVIVFTE